MKLGLQVNHFTWQGGDTVIGPIFGSIGRKAEEAGFDSLWVMDHFFQIGGLGKPNEPMLEGYSALALIAGQTKKIKLGTLVTGVTYRHPGILIKTVTTLDVLSEGRAYLGIGAGWNEQEHRGLGVPFPPLKERFERLEETLQIVHQMWSGDEKPYNGKYYHLARLLNSPRPVQRPHPPILIGGSGERKTLRLVAQYGDACNLFARLGKEALQHKLDVLREHCEALGRPYEQIEKTTLNSVKLTRDGRDESTTPVALVDFYADQASIGIDQGIFSLQNVTDPEVFDLLASEVIPQVDRIAVAGR